MRPTSAPSGAFLMKPALQLGEVDVEHHDDEQEQHGHRADVDDDQDHRQELGAEQHEQPRRVEEGEDQEQHGVHGVLGGDHHEARGHREGREQIEEERRQAHIADPLDFCPSALHEVVQPDTRAIPTSLSPSPHSSHQPCYGVPKKVAQSDAHSSTPLWV